MPFEKGHTYGNRFTSENQPENNGRPKKLKALDVILADVVGDDGMTRVIEKLHQLAEKGNINAAQIILDRGYGKPKQSLEVQGQISLTPQINIKPKDENNNDISGD